MKAVPVFEGGPRSTSERLSAIALIGAGYLLAVVLVDPLRDVMTQDDGWAYARSVQHLLATGRYQLDAWAAANMPVQVYVAAALAKLFGYSATLLRLQTLALLAAGLAGFYALLRELRLRPLAAAVLCLTLLACPLVLLLGFTFMSDVQFMSWMVLALWLYVRGLARNSDGAVFLGSVMAACAIGTRQFGMAMIAAWVVVWCLASRPRPSPRRMLAAIGLPILTSVWQLKAGLEEPSFTQAVRLHEQADFWAHSFPYLAREIAWRLATLLQYLGFLMVPLFPVMAALAARMLRHSSRRAASSDAWSAMVRTAVAVLLGLVVVGFWRAGSAMTTRPGGGLWLPLWWMLPGVFEAHAGLMKALTIAGLAGALLLLLLAAHQWPAWSRRRTFSSTWLLIGALGVCMVALHVPYLQLNDTYLVGLLPLALLVPARALRGDTTTLRAWLMVSPLLCAFAIVPMSWLMRGQYDDLEVSWQAASKLVKAGVDARCIVAPRPWAEYHGGFDDWIAETYPAFNRKRGETSPARPGSFHDDYWRWIDQRSHQAKYLVSTPWDKSGLAWQIVDTVEYAKQLDEPRKIVTYARVDTEAGGPATCGAHTQ